MSFYDYTFGLCIPPLELIPRPITGLKFSAQEICQQSKLSVQTSSPVVAYGEV
jgi:hypothetical protein